jgi:hypothetical protein
MIDTLKLSKGLQKAGMTSAQADGIADALKDAQGDYLTKQDLQFVQTDLEHQLQTVKSDLEHQLQTVKSDLEQQMGALELRLVKLINDSRNQTLLAIGLLVLAQIGLHFWR